MTSSPMSGWSKNAITQSGVLTIHQVGDQWLLEIPPEVLGRPFYWYSELSRVRPI